MAEKSRFSTDGVYFWNNSQTWSCSFNTQFFSASFADGSCAEVQDVDFCRCCWFWTDSSCAPSFLFLAYSRIVWVVRHKSKIQHPATNMCSRVDQTTSYPKVQESTFNFQWSSWLHQIFFFKKSHAIDFCDSSFLLEANERWSYGYMDDARVQDSACQARKTPSKRARTICFSDDFDSDCGTIYFYWQLHVREINIFTRKQPLSYSKHW